jgi:hypothetical protein
VCRKKTGASFHQCIDAQYNHIQDGKKNPGIDPSDGMAQRKPPFFYDPKNIKHVG